MDDVAEKARRNLLMVSAGILAVWALGIPLDGKLVGAVDLSSVEPWRAWATALAVLIYFALRHYFAPPTYKAWSSWAQRRKQWFYTARQDVLTQCTPSRDTVASAQTLFKDNRMTFKGADLPADHDWIANGGKIISWKGRHGSMKQLWNKYVPGVMVVTVSGREADHISHIQFTMRRRTYGWLTMKSWIQAYRPSWELLELSFPWMLALGAAVVCFCKLAASLYYSFPFVRQLLPT